MQSWYCVSDDMESTMKTMSETNWMKQLMRRHQRTVFISKCAVKGKLLLGIWIERIFFPKMDHGLTTVSLLPLETTANILPIATNLAQSVRICFVWQEEDPIPELGQLKDSSENAHILTTVLFRVDDNGVESEVRSCTCGFFPLPFQCRLQVEELTSIASSDRWGAIGITNNLVRWPWVHSVWVRWRYRLHRRYSIKEKSYWMITSYPVRSSATMSRFIVNWTRSERKFVRGV